MEAVESSGQRASWIKGERGHGPALRFATPDSHEMEISWEVERFRAGPDATTLLKNRPQRRPLRGTPVKRIDDVNLLASDVHMVKSFLTDTLGFRLRERKMLRDGTWAGAWLSVSALSHDIAIMHDRTGARGRLHHVCYYYGYPQHLWDVADICIDQGVKIEHGPGKHGTGQALFLCVIEPGGNRIELFGDVGYLVFEPDWQPVTWTEDDDLLRSTSWIGAVAPSEFYLYGTPPVGATSPPPNQPTAGRSTQS